MNGDCRAFGRTVPTEMVGELADVSALLAAPNRLRRRLADDGYALLRGVLDEGEVMAAREAVFRRLHEVGEIDSPARDGIATGASRRRTVAGDLGRFWKSVVDMPALRRVTNGPRLGRVMETVWGEPARGMDYLFLRAGAPGSATGLHYDFPFFTRTTPRMYTVWVPVGPVPVTDGSLVVVEGSRRFDDILEHLDGFDIELDDTPAHRRRDEVGGCPRTPDRQSRRRSPRRRASPQQRDEAASSRDSTLPRRRGDRHGAGFQGVATDQASVRVCGVDLRPVAGGTGRGVERD